MHLRRLVDATDIPRNADSKNMPQGQPSVLHNTPHGYCGFDQATYKSAAHTPYQGGQDRLTIGLAARSFAHRFQVVAVFRATIAGRGIRAIRLLTTDMERWYQLD
jgi:hypothetical protein